MQIFYFPFRQRCLLLLKLRNYEKATKFENNLPRALAKHLFLLSSVKKIGRFFQIFVVFSDKLNFTLYSNFCAFE